jgi:hypothetical protein
MGGVLSGLHCDPGSATGNAGAGGAAATVAVVVDGATGGNGASAGAEVEGLSEEFMGGEDVLALDAAGCFASHGRQANATTPSSSTTVSAAAMATPLPVAVGTCSRGRCAGIPAGGAASSWRVDSGEALTAGLVIVNEDREP